MTETELCTFKIWRKDNGRLRVQYDTVFGIDEAVAVELIKLRGEKPKNYSIRIFEAIEVLLKSL